MSVGIYCLRNIVNGKRYIGQSTNIEMRTKHHFYDLKRGVHYNRHLQGSFTKYGVSNFEFHILEEVGEDMLDVREQSWINYFQTMDDKYGYNLDGGGCLTRIVSKQTRLKISEAIRKLPPPSIETRSKISKANLGRKHSDESRQRMSEAQRGNKNNLGKHHSEETLGKLSSWKRSDKTRKKMSESAKKRLPFSEETRSRMSASGKIKKFSEDHRRNISKAGMGRKLSLDNLMKMQEALRLKREKIALIGRQNNE